MHKTSNAKSETTKLQHASKAGLLSAPAYFGCVIFVTMLVVAIAALLRPNIAMDIAFRSGIKKTPQSSADSFYDVRVIPIFEKNCISCHGERRQKGKLRMDSFAGLVRGGKSGFSIEAGNAAESELYRRIILPLSDEKVMPPKGKKPLSEDDKTIIELWITHGASGTLLADAIQGAPEPIKEVVFPKLDRAVIAKTRLALASKVKDLQARFPGVISYQSRGSADIIVNASLLGQAFRNEHLAELLPLRDRIVWLDASRTGISDASAEVLVQMKQLHVLRLMNTQITDKSIQSLKELPDLKSLSVVGTGVSNSALEPIEAQGVNIYATDFDA